MNEELLKKLLLILKIAIAITAIIFLTTLIIIPLTITMITEIGIIIKKILPIIIIIGIGLIGFRAIKRK